MSAAAAPAAAPAPVAPELVRAEAVRRYLAEHRRRRRPSLFTIYVALLTVAIFGALGESVLAAIVGGGLAQRSVAQFGATALALLLLAAARFGVWQGPVSFRVPDVVLVLLAPLSIASLVRSRLDHALVVAAASGAVLGTAAALLAAGGVSALGAARAVALALGMAATGALAIALSWLVEASPRASRTVARAGPLLVALALAPLVAAAGHVGAVIAAWSGPWGWAVQPFTGRAGWPVATALLLVVAFVAVWVARRRVAVADAIVFLERAEVRTGMTTAAFTLDYRGVATARRGAGGRGGASRAASAPSGGGLGRDGPPGAGSAARGGLRGAAAGDSAGRFGRAGPGRVGVGRAGAGRLASGRLTVPRPRSPRLAIPWRDALSSLRGPGRAGAAALVTAAAVTEAATHPGRGLPAAVCAVALYAAAALVLEPLRDEVDHPDRGAVLLSRRFASLLLAHCAVPAAILTASGAVTIAVLVAAGVAGPLLLLTIPTLLLAASAVAVLSAALATRRGGRLDGDTMGRLAIVDPSSPAFGAALIIVLAPWLLVSGAVLTVAVALLGRAVTHHDRVLSAGVELTVLAGIAALVLLRLARRSRQP